VDVTHDRDDYKLLVSERGMTEDQVKKIVENELDMTPLPFGAYKFTFDESPIHGRGVFAVSNIIEGEVIGPARIGTSRTYLGRLTNHSVTPNSFPKLNGKGGIDLVANRPIGGCSGGIKGEEITVNYRDSSAVANMLDKEMGLCLHS
jgi:hypothetical protein